MSTIRINGKPYDRDIQLLIDSGSTNCFLDVETAHNLGYSLEYTTSLLVNVADGSKVVNRVYCPNFTLKLNYQAFTTCESLSWVAAK